MEKLLKTYETTIINIEEQIKKLKKLLKTERNIEKVHDLERRIDLLMTERREMIYICAEIRSHLAPKAIHPSVVYRAVSGDI